MKATFSTIAGEIGLFEFAEVEVTVSEVNISNPFTDITLVGILSWEGETKTIEGFSDSTDGKVLKARFMPQRPGKHEYSLCLTVGGWSTSASGSFNAVRSRSEGLLKIDPQHPFHFIRSASANHFFWNGTTAYFLFGWEYSVACAVLDRLQKKGINQVRAALCARTYGGSNWSEDDVIETSAFTLRLCPWIAENPDSVESPNIDVTRFDVKYWRHVESILAYARELGMILSIIFYVDGQHARVDPFGKEGMGSEDEVRYYRYAAARLSAFENITWCVTNEYHLFRTDEWVEQMGAVLSRYDPYGHIKTVHGFGEFRFMASEWPGYASYQVWDEPGGNAFMLRQRELQLQSGKIMPQVNEEYGYEDTYPQWGFEYVRPMRSADTRRKIAWSISMAGCYQTTGERADTGTGAGPDTGGGWINGRGDDTMVMLDGYKKMVDFFTSLPWYRMTPSNNLVSGDALCLSLPDQAWAVYLPNGGETVFSVPPGRYRFKLFDTLMGSWEEGQAVEVQNGYLLKSDPGQDAAWRIDSLTTK